MKSKYSWGLLILIQLFFSNCHSEKEVESKQLSQFISNIEIDDLGQAKPEIIYEPIIEDSLFKITVSWTLKDTIRQNDLQINITPAFTPNFHWSPHLTPTDDHIIPQHVFRSPALIVSSPSQQLSIVPDLDAISKTPVDWYMDLNAPKNRLTLGLSLSKIKEHVLYVRDTGAIYIPGKITMSFFVFIENRKSGGISNPWRSINAFLWKNWGKELYEERSHENMQPYLDHTYNWAFKYWKPAVWQQFENDNKKIVGAPKFIVNITQSPNYLGKPEEREFISIWNQAWFNSLRSASGLYRYAIRNNKNELKEFALKTKELALSFPQKKGFFSAVIMPAKTGLDSKGNWKGYVFGNSNRNPYTGDPKESPYHILDMSVTANYMLNWYKELEKDKRLLDYATSYADALIEKQGGNGFFPGWLDLESLKPMNHLNQSPETSMSATFLLKLYSLTQDERYKDSALKAVKAVMNDIIPVGRWEDFETYWSCSRYGEHDLVNQKVTRNDMYKQNNFSMYWTAQALLEAYKLTKKEEYLRYGQRTLDELLMTQATWQPDFMYVPVLGGFGVMNGDAEWNDARQSLFSELIIEYGEILNNQEYVQRGLAALRASFFMMYGPENKTTKKQWEARWPFFGKEDYGFMMENYGHNGSTNKDGMGIGEFTIYDWGNGSASEAYNRILDHYGEKFILEN